MTLRITFEDGSQQEASLVAVVEIRDGKLVFRSLGKDRGFIPLERIARMVVA